MECTTAVSGAKDEKKAAKGMPEGSTIHRFPVSNFGTFDQSVGFCIEEAVNLSANTVFNSTEVSWQEVPTDHDLIGCSDKFDRGKSSAFVAVSDSSDRLKGNLDQKAYVQQLESSRLKLTQLEQELRRASQQGIFISSSGDKSHSTGGNEYARWLEEQNRQVNESRTAVKSHASDAELRIIVDGVVAHYDEVFRLKSNAAKADVFHLLWKTPAERCFLWLGGFRSSELLKVVHPSLPLSLLRMVLTNSIFSLFFHFRLFVGSDL